MFVLLRDITERKRAEEELDRYHLEQLEERSTELIRVNKQLQQDITEREHKSNCCTMLFTTG